MSAPSAFVLPSNVPAELLRSYPLSFGSSAGGDPFTELVTPIHQGPAIFYAADAYSGGRAAWIVRRAEDLRTIYLDTDHFSNEDFAPFAKLVGESWGLIPAETDPPAHALYRNFVNPIFTPRAINELDEKLVQYARAYVGELAQRDGCDFMADFAFEFPIRVFLELMGLPQGESKHFLKWVADLLHAPDLDTLIGATREVVAFLRSLAEERKRNPGDDLVSFGVQARIEGRKLTDDEILGFCFNLFVGGLDTVSANMGLHFWHLARHVEDQRHLRAKPEIIPVAIDELMRAYANVTTFRTCKKERSLGGITFLPGDKIAMSTTLAGRDPEEYDRPNEILLERKPRTLSFAFGVHTCVGIHLARREMRIALQEFLSGIPEFRLAPGADVRFYLHGVIQPTSLPLRWKR